MEVGEGEGKETIFAFLYNLEEGQMVDRVRVLHPSGRIKRNIIGTNIICDCTQLQAHV